MNIYSPHKLTMNIMRCSMSKGLRAEIFRICMNHDASYCDSPNHSIMWIESSDFDDSYDLVVEVKTSHRHAKTKKIEEATEDLCNYRGFKVETVLERCTPYEQNWVKMAHFMSSGISPEYSPTPSVSSTKECQLSMDVQLRMIEDQNKSYIRVSLIVEKCHLVPRYKYKKFENDPMNLIYLTHNLHYPLDNSEIRVNDRGRSVAVPKICFSLAKDELPDQYHNALISKECFGHRTQMTEVFLAILFRVSDDGYITSVFDLLKPGSKRDGNMLITSVFIRHEYESVEDFEDFVRENKSYSMRLWSKAPEMSFDLKDEYELEEEDIHEIEIIASEKFAVKRKRE